MKHILWVAVICAASGGAVAQQMMDLSANDFDEPVADILIQGLIGQVPDPYSAQVIKIHRSPREPKDICGLVNLKNPNGGYTGFRPFMISDGHVLIEGVSACQ